MRSAAAVAALALCLILPGCINLSHPVWSPDGTKVAFSDDDGEGGIDIYIANADGSGMTKLVSTPGDDLWPIWSPDGTRIAFCTEQRQEALNDGVLDADDIDGNDRHDVFVINVDGTGLVNVSSSPADDGFPAWSPDSTRIVFTAHRDDACALYVVKADGSGLRRLTEEGGDDALASWSPDGRKILFSRASPDEDDEDDEDPPGEICVVNADGSQLTRLTSPAAPVSLAAWSPSGARIAFASKREGSYDIYTINSDGSGLARLTRSADDEGWPIWAPDGSKIAYLRVPADEDEYGPPVWGRDLWVINADGSQPVQLTHTDGEEWFPAWSPDGSMIVFGFSEDEEGGDQDGVYVINADGSGQRRLDRVPGAPEQ